MNSNNSIIGDGGMSHPSYNAHTQGPSTSKTNDSKSPKGKSNNNQAQGNQGIELRFISWNLGTLNDRPTALLEDLRKQKINIAFLQDTKMIGKGCVDMEEYTHYYSSVGETAEGQTKYYGVGVLLHKELKENFSVMNVNYINDRLIHLRLRFKGINMILNVVSLYAPQVNLGKEIKKTFWDNFDRLMINIPANEQIIFGGDFNAHVGKNDTGCERVHGGWGYGDRNTEGQTLLDTALIYDLAILNTWFPTPSGTLGDLVTYVNGNNRTQIDYFLTRRCSISCIKNCQVLNGLDLQLEHKPLILEVQFNNPTNTIKKSLPLEINWYKLEKEEYADKFKIKVINKIKKCLKDKNKKNVDNCWIEMANYIKSIAKGICGAMTKTEITDIETWWWNDDTKNAGKEKTDSFEDYRNTVRGKVSTVGQEEKKNIYNKCSSNVQEVIASAEDNALVKRFESLDISEYKRDYYDIAKIKDNIEFGPLPVELIKNEEGTVLNRELDIKERWKRYFKTLMNQKSNFNKLENHDEYNDKLVPKITMEEVKNSIERMKKGKLVGPDGIPVEVWKVLGEIGCKWLTLLFCKLLDMGEIPKEWCNIYILPTYYKNEYLGLDDCRNYRGIKIASHTLEVWENVLESRMRKECKLSLNQFGLRADQQLLTNFALRIECEEYRRFKKNLHLVCIDLEESYDRISREVLWWALVKKGMPNKYISLVRALYSLCDASVQTAVGLTGMFNVSVGLRHKSPLSFYLFHLVMDVLSQIHETATLQTIITADKILFYGESSLQDKFTIWKEKLEGIGLAIDRTNTKYMFCQFNEENGVSPITIDNIELKNSPDLHYLGSIVQSDLRSNCEISRIIRLMSIKWSKHMDLLCNPQICLELKAKIYSSFVRPVLMDKSECWVTLTDDENRINSAESRMLSYMYGPVYEEISEIRKMLGIKFDIIEEITAKRQIFYSEVMDTEEFKTRIQLTDAIWKPGAGPRSWAHWIRQYLCEVQNKK